MASEIGFSLLQMPKCPDQPPIQWVLEVFSPGLNNKSWSYASAPHIRLPVMARDNFTHHFTFMLQHNVIDFFLNNQPNALVIQIYSVIKLSTCFGHLLCPSSRVFYCTSATGKFHAGFDDPFQAQSGRNWFHPDSAWKRSPKPA